MCSTTKHPPIDRIYIFLAIGVLVASASSILVRLASTHPIVTAFFRMLFSAAIMWTAVYIRHKKVILPDKRQQLLLVFSGVMLGIHFASWMTSLEYMSVAMSVIIVDMSPIAVILLSYLVFGEEISRRSMGGVIIAICGALVIVADAFNSYATLTGVALASIGAIAVAVYLVIGRRMRSSMDTLPYVAYVYSYSAATILIIAGILGYRLDIFSNNDLLIYLTLAIGPSCLGHTIYNHCLGYVSPSVVSATILAEPIGAGIIAMVLFSEIPTVFTIVGGAAILYGIWIVMRHVEVDKELM